MTHHYKARFAGIELKSDDTGDDPAAIVTKALEDLRATVDERLKPIEGKAADLGKIAERLDRIELKMNRPGGGAKSDDERAAIERKAFDTFLRRGDRALGADEMKTLQVSVDTQGGYLAPPDFVREVDKNVVQFSPVRQAARVGSTMSDRVEIPRRTGRPTASWVGETQTRSSTESAYGQITIPVHEIACYVDCSNKLLEDAAVDVGAEIAFDLSEEFGRAEGAAFISGNGILKPLGLLSDDDLSYTASGSATSVADGSGQANGLIDLFYALAPFYRQRGVWMMNGTTLASIRKMQDTTKQYIWQPALAAGQPETILGRPVVEAVDMPDQAAGSFPVLFGDFASAFRIYDRVSMALIRDPYTIATEGKTRFHARRRVGGGVVRAEAVRKLKCATS